MERRTEKETRWQPLKVGIMLSDTEREIAGGSARWRGLLAMARTAEDAGFDSLWVSDNLLFRFKGTVSVLIDLPGRAGRPRGMPPYLTRSP